MALHLLQHTGREDRSSRESLRSSSLHLTLGIRFLRRVWSSLNSWRVPVTGRGGGPAQVPYRSALSRGHFVWGQRGSDTDKNSPAPVVQESAWLPCRSCWVGNNAAWNKLLKRRTKFHPPFSFQSLRVDARFLQIYFVSSTYPIIWTTF